MTRLRLSISKWNLHLVKIFIRANVHNLFDKLNIPFVIRPKNLGLIAIPRRVTPTLPGIWSLLKIKNME